MVRDSHNWSYALLPHTLVDREGLSSGVTIRIIAYKTCMLRVYASSEDPLFALSIENAQIVPRNCLPNLSCKAFRGFDAAAPARFLCMPDVVQPVAARIEAVQPVKSHCSDLQRLCCVSRDLRQLLAPKAFKAVAMDSKRAATDDVPYNVAHCAQHLFISLGSDTLYRLKCLQQFGPQVEHLHLQMSRPRHTLSGSGNTCISETLAMYACHFFRLNSLHLEAPQALSDSGAGLAQLFSSTFKALSSLVLHCTLDTATASYFFRAPLCQLTHLTIKPKSLVGNGILQLAAAQLPCLTELNLHDNFLGNEGFQKLCEAPWPQLQRLEIPRSGIKTLLPLHSACFAATLQQLNIEENLISTLQPLQSCPYLHTLCAELNSITSAQSLFGATHIFAQARRLQLGGNKLSNDAVKVLADALNTDIEELSLIGCDMRGEGMRMISHRSLPRLRCAQLYGNSTAGIAIDALIRRWPELQTLDLGDTGIHHLDDLLANDAAMAQIASTQMHLCLDFNPIEPDGQMRIKQSTIGPYCTMQSCGSVPSDDEGAA